ncbi:MBL fold metallo-hydrolase [Nitrospira sp. Kam-Ns4a]
MWRRWEQVPSQVYVGLRPWVWTQFESDPAPGPFPFLAGVAPEVVACLQEAHQRLSGAIDVAISDVFAGRAAVGDPAHRVRLENAYAEVVQSRPHLRAHIRCGRNADGTFTWDYPLDASRRAAPLPYSALRIFNAMTRQTLPVDLEGHPAAEVGRLIGCLDGTWTAGALRRELDRWGTAWGAPLRTYCLRLLELLLAHDCVNLTAQASVRAQWLRATQDRDLVHLGHAALMYRQGDQFLFFDPWLVPWFAEAPVPSLWTSLLPKPAAIFLTHEHDDHVDPRTLLALPKETPVIVPSRTNRRGLYYDYQALLGGLGFTRIIELAHGESWRFDGGAVVSVPFYGECACELGLPRNCYLIVDRGRNVLVHVDSGPTNSGVSLVKDGVIDDLVRRFGPIQVVCAQPGQLLELRTFAAYACLSPPGRWLEVGENCCVTPEYLAELAARARAQLLVAYANGGADWLPDHPVFVFNNRNRALREMVTAHWWPLERLAEHLASVGCRCHHSRARDLVRDGRDGAPVVLSGAGPAPDRLYAADHGLPPRPVPA